MKIEMVENLPKSPNDQFVPGAVYRWTGNQRPDDGNMRLLAVKDNKAMMVSLHNGTSCSEGTIEYIKSTIENGSYVLTPNTKLLVEKE